MSKPVKRTRGVAATAALAAAMAVGGGLLPLTAGAAAPRPQLSIAVDNQQDGAIAGDPLAYTVTVTNLGTKAVEDLLVSQTVPAGATFTKADGTGEERSGTVQWKIDLPATEVVTFHTRMAVSRATPDDLLRLATVACAKSSPKAAALVCASDSDQLPAGAQADERRRAAEAPSADPRRWYAAGAAGLVGAGLVAAALLVRARSRRRGGPGGQQPAG